MKHSAFVKAHPYIEDFYTAEQKTRSGKRCVRRSGGHRHGVGAILVFVAAGETEYERGGDSVGFIPIAPRCGFSSMRA